MIVLCFILLDLKYLIDWKDMDIVPESTTGLVILIICPHLYTTILVVCVFFEILMIKEQNRCLAVTA